MSKRIISLLLVMLLCLGVLPVQSLAAAQTVTRVEWVQALVAACSMTVEDDVCPDHYFSDMSAEDNFYRDVIVAVEFGLIDTPVGLAFNPQEPATREFVAHTLNAALMFQLPEDTVYTYGEADTVTYPDDIQVSLNQGWFTLVNGAFLPQQAVTVGEKTAILASVTQILDESEVDPTHENSYTFAEGVKAIEDTEDVYLTEDNQVVITGSSVELTGGDVFVVWIMGLPYAFRATAVSVDGNVMTVTADPVELEDVVLTMDIQGESDVDLAYFVPAEGFEPVYTFEDGSETTSRAHARAQTKKVREVHVPINLDFDNVKVSGTVSLTNMKISHSLKVLSDWYAMFRLDGDLQLTPTVEFDMLGLAGISKSYMIGGINYGIGEAGVYIVIQADGTCTLTLRGDFSVGVEVSNINGLRNLSRFKRTEFSLVTEMKFKAGVQVKASIDAAGVSAHAYFEAGAKANIKNDLGENRNCLDIVAYPYAEVDCSYSVNLIVWKDSQSHHYDLLKEGDTPKIHEHYENGMRMTKCSFGDVSCNGWQGSWNKYSLGGVIHSSSSNSDGSQKLYDYTLDEENRATITKYRGTAGSLYIPKTLDSYEVVAIGDSAFANNSYLRSVTIPNSIQSIGEEVFRNCKNLHTVKLSTALTVIPNYAFQNTALVTMDIPDSVTHIGNYAFDGCTKLANVTMSKNLEYLGFAAFRDCASLTQINIPKTLTTCDDFSSRSYGAFAGCTNLKTVVLEEGMTAIPAYLLFGCGSLESILIPDTVTHIGNYAFDGCANLASITIPDTVTHIGNRAFDGCAKLANVTMSKNLEYLGFAAFRDCTSLTQINIPKTLTTCDDFAGRSNGAFAGCTNLKTVVLEEGMTAIPAYLFIGCEGIESISIPDTVTTIGRNAFAASGLLEFTLPETVTSIGEYVFNECPNLTKVTWNSKIPVIPRSTFCDATSLKTVVLPDTVTTLSASSFQNCDTLTNIALPDTVTSIGNSCFYDCDALTSITIPNGVPSLGSSCFYDCDALTTVVMGDTVTSMGSGIFEHCDQLSNVTLSQNLKIIPENAFKLCPALTAVTVPYYVTEIKNGAFNSSTGLTDVYLPRGLTAIGTGAFSYQNVTTIHGVPGTYVETWARNNGFTFADHEVHVQTVKLSVPTLTLYTGKTHKLLLTVTPKNFTDAISWKSTNTDVVTVTEDGTVKAVGVGTATVKVTVGNVSTSCKITVLQSVTRIHLNYTRLSLNALDTCQLTATVSPNNAANKTLAWSSSNESVATVDENGKVTAVGKGTATITASATDGSGVSNKCTITVTSNGYIVTDVNTFESSHDYPTDCTDFWVYTKPNAAGLKVTFDERTHIEDEFDWLLIYNGVGHLIGKYTGDQLTGATVEIPGSTVKIQLQSDDSGTDWGFKVSAIEITGCAHRFENGKCVNCGLDAFTGLRKVDGIWYYYKNGEIATHITSLVKYNGEWWYVVEGKVASTTTAMVELNGELWYVVKGKIAGNTTGLVKYDGVWYYVVKGKVAGNTTNLVKYNGEWFYVVNGKVASSTTSMVLYNGEWFYMVKGKLAAKTTTLVKHEGKWCYVYNGKLAGKTTTLVKYNNEWFYVINGYVDSQTTGIVLYSGGWYYLVKGKIAAKTTTLVKYGNAWYYVSAGSVDWSYTGNFTYSGKVYKINKGRVV